MMTPDFTVEFYKLSTDEKPYDGYPQFRDDKTLAFACYNWLQMYPTGKIVIKPI